MFSSCEFHRNAFSIIAKRRKYVWHRGMEDGRTETARDNAKNIMPPAAEVGL